MKNWRKMLSFFLCLVMTATMLPGLALAEEGESDVEQIIDCEEQTMEEKYPEPETPELEDAEETAFADPVDETVLTDLAEVFGDEENTPESAITAEEQAPEQEETVLPDDVSEGTVSDDTVEWQEESEEEFLLALDSDDEEEDCGENLTWEIDYNGKLIISGTGNMYHFTADLNADGSIGDCSSVFYPFRDEILTIEINEGVTGIGSYAFAGCTRLTDVSFPESLNEIGMSAFLDCTSLSSLEFPEGMEMERIGESTFSGCVNLSFVKLPAGIKKIEKHLFSRCSELSTILFSDGAIVIEDYVLSGCSKLRYVSIPGSVTAIGDSVFDGCDDLREVNFDGSREEWLRIFIGSNNEILNEIWMHYLKPRGHCGDNLTWVLDDEGALTISGTGPMDDYSEENMPPWMCESDIVVTSITFESGITSIGSWAFYGQDLTGALTIPAGVTKIGAEAFFGCLSLEGVSIPSSLTRIEDKAFYFSGLTGVTIPASVTYIGENAFGECYSMAGITVDSKNSVYASQNGVLFNKRKTQLLCYPSGKTGTEYTVPDSVTSIGSFGFGVCKNLTTVRIPDSVTSIGDGAFFYCENLVDVNIPAGVTYLGNEAFYFCALTSVTIPKGITGISSSTFYNCRLTSVMIPGNIESIGESAFCNCKQLTDVTISEGVENIGYYAFAYCSMLQSVTFPASLKKIGNRVFHDCSRLKTITFLSPAPSADNSAFYNITATAYYPKDDNSWTEEVRKNFGGTITWIGQRETWIYIEGKKAIKLNNTIEACVSGTSSTTYSPELAYYLMGLSRAAYSETDICLSLQSMGFENGNIRTSSDYQNGTFNDRYAAYALAKKQLEDGTTLVMIMVRGSTGWKEWILTDFKPGSALTAEVGLHRGFMDSVYRLYEDLEDFLGGKIQTGNTTYVVTGHSLGAATANIVSVKLLAELVPTASVYDYNFACPDVGTSPYSHTRWEEEYPSIFNIADARDPVSIVPGMLGKVFADGTWFKFGKSRWFSDDWTNPNQVNLAAKAHDKDNYLSKLSSRPSFSRFYDRFRAAAARTETLPKARFRLFGIRCPVDVVVYDSSGAAIAGVTNGIPDYYNSEYGEVFIATMDDEKVIAVPEGKDYTVKLTGTEAGEMEYDVILADAITQEFVEDKKFEAVSLKPGKEFISAVISEMAVADVKLYVVDDNDMPVQEVQEDGTEVELPEAADKTQLQAAIAYAEGLAAADYTADSWSVMQTALASAKIILLKADATQNEVDTATAELDNAVAALEEKQPETRQFDDVQDPGAYYYKPVYWAVGRGVTNGTSPTTFSPGKDCTRGQIVTFLWKAMGSPEPSSTNNPFIDVKESDYFYKPVLWAKENGITSGTSETTFSPGKPCTRGQIETFLWIANGRPEPGSTENPFTDVKTTDYFFKPVLWAKENKITSGTSASTFSPGNTCTRAQAMTFLWIASGRP